MPLSKSVLSTLIQDKIKAKKGTPANDDELVDFADAIADAIVTHITTAAVVNTTVAVASVSGVTPGPGVSGPGAGTGVGAIT